MEKKTYDSPETKWLSFDTLQCLAASPWVVGDDVVDDQGGKPSLGFENDNEYDGGFDIWDDNEVSY